eukprot:COSAG03_NODE_3648_length_1899_cov_1.996667_2_plen_191_part_00
MSFGIRKTFPGIDTHVCQVLTLDRHLAQMYATCAVHFLRILKCLLLKCVAVAVRTWIHENGSWHSEMRISSFLCVINYYSIIIIHSFSPSQFPEICQWYLSRAMYCRALAAPEDGVRASVALEGRSVVGSTVHNQCGLWALGNKVDMENIESGELEAGSPLKGAGAAVKWSADFNGKPTPASSPSIGPFQ